jgi:hypothetical protein
MAGRELSERVATWLDAGLIDADQAHAITAFEQQQAGRELPRWVEPVAYLGATLVAMALVLFGVQVWDRLATWGQVALAATITLVLLVTGLALHRGHADAARRAGSFAWLLTVAGVAATSGLLLFQLVDLGDDPAVVLMAIATAAAALALYLVARTSLQQLALAASTGFVVLSLGSLLPLEPEAWTVTLLLFAIGAIWLLLSWGGVLTPQRTGLVIGGLFTLLIGFGISDSGQALWSGLGIVVSLGLVYLSTTFDTRALLALGVIGLVVWIPATVTTLFEGSVVVPVAILLTGVVTLSVVVAAVRSDHHDEPAAEAPQKETVDA